MKVIRYIIFIPICLLALGIVYWAFGHLLYWFAGLKPIWLFLVLITFGGLIWYLFIGLSTTIMKFTSMIAPNRKFSFWTVLVLSIINGIYTIFNAWAIVIKNGGKPIFATLVFTVLIIELTFALIYGSYSAVEDS